MANIQTRTIVDKYGKYDYQYIYSYKKEKRGSELNDLYPNIGFVVEENKLKQKYLGAKGKLDSEQINMEKRKMEIKKQIKIEDLKDKMGNINLVAEIKLIQPLREHNGQKVTSARIADETGECNLDLWNEDATTFKEGDKIRLSSGYAKQKVFENEKGELVNTFDLTKGRYGILKKETQNEV